MGHGTLRGEELEVDTPGHVEVAAGAGDPDEVVVARYRCRIAAVNARKQTRGQSSDGAGVVRAVTRRRTHAVEGAGRSWRIEDEVQRRHCVRVDVIDRVVWPQRREPLWGQQVDH